MTRRACLAGLFAFVVTICVAVESVRAELPNSVLNVVYPTGVRAGESVTVTLEGAALDGLRGVTSTAPGLTAEKLAGNQLRVSVPADTPPGIYDLRAFTDHGLSSPRAFVVSRNAELSETSPNDTADTALAVSLTSTINGRIEKASDVDCYQFRAQRGECVVIECWAERIDSQLRGVLELYDSNGKRLAANRGHTGLDPRLVFQAPADGDYVVRVFDLSFLGSPTHFYRLDLDTQPRPEFALPCVVTRGVPTQMTVWGYHLQSGQATPELASTRFRLTPPTQAAPFVARPQRTTQPTTDLSAIRVPDGNMPLAVSVTDHPVVENYAGHEQANRALPLSVPCEVSAQLADGFAQHWYTVDAKRGEVLWFEAWGERLGSPLDMELSVLDTTSKRELARFTDELNNLGGYRFSTQHTDPVGRWVAPADGRFLLLMRNVIGGSERDPRRIYRLSVRREEPDFELYVVSRRTDQPVAWNVPRGGRESCEVLALRRNGHSAGIRITAENVPPGFECAETFIGPGQVRAPLVISTAREATPFAGSIEIVGHSDFGGATQTRRAVGGSMIWANRPAPSGRQTQSIPLATGLAAPFTLHATPRVTSLDQESVLEIDVALEAHGAPPSSPVKLSLVGLPRDVERGQITLPLERTAAAMSLFLPASLPPGKYTCAVQAELEASVVLTSAGKPTKTSLTLVSNPLTLELKPARVLLTVDPANPTKIARCKIIQLKFHVQRVQGFLGKVHVELEAPEGVQGVRGRGVTLVGQSDSGSLQVIATDNAPLGKHAQLRLDAVGTVEDQPVFRASRYVDLEIVE
ncbi:MAG: pre-peptidase C-terminal domain-containing protein [Planctomycetaceae bacterium]|nr:pre-peptidase C-terminal domain-containing protein [Planctomycetaceae bacterium]